MSSQGASHAGIAASVRASHEGLEPIHQMLHEHRDDRRAAESVERGIPRPHRRRYGVTLQSLSRPEFQLVLGSGTTHSRLALQRTLGFFYLALDLELALRVVEARGWAACRPRARAGSIGLGGDELDVIRRRVGLQELGVVGQLFGPFVQGLFSASNAQ